MTPGEAIRLLIELSHDPSSHLSAAAGGWDAPWSRESLIFADLYDAFAHVNSKGTPKPYPRPFRQRASGEQYGRTNLSPAEARRILDAVGPPKRT